MYLPHSLKNAREFVQEKSAHSDQSLTLIIQSNQDGAEPMAVGLIGLRDICRRSMRAEIWIYIGELDQWGKGVGTAAIKVLCEYAFNEANMHRLWLECDPENYGAVRCYEKNGFKKEGVHKHGYFRHGSYRDTMTMGLIRPDWHFAGKQMA